DSLWLDDDENMGIEGEAGGGYAWPRYLVFGADGKLYIGVARQSDGWGGSGVIRYDPSQPGIVAPFVPFNASGLGNGGQMAFGPDGNLDVSDESPGSNPVKRFDGKTGV